MLFFKATLAFIYQEKNWGPAKARNTEACRGCEALYENREPLYQEQLIQNYRFLYNVMQTIYPILKELLKIKINIDVVMRRNLNKNIYFFKTTLWNGHIKNGVHLFKIEIIFSVPLANVSLVLCRAWGLSNKGNFRQAFQGPLFVSFPGDLSTTAKNNNGGRRGGGEVRWGNSYPATLPSMCNQLEGWTVLPLQLYLQTPALSTSLIPIHKSTGSDPAKLTAYGILKKEYYTHKNTLKLGLLTASVLSQLASAIDEISTRQAGFPGSENLLEQSSAAWS